MRDSDREKAAEGLAEPEADLAPEPGPDLEEVFAEVSKILTTRRWQAREAPFRGFGSPPGKF